MRIVDANEFRALVPMERAIDAVESAFRAADAHTPPREHVSFGDGELLFMPSSNPRAAGVKLVTVNPANPDRGVPLINGTYLLFDRDTLAPRAAIDAAALTAVRTAAVSGVATRALAAPDASRLVVFGSGVQAHSHLDAMLAVRPIASVRVVGRDRDSVRPLVERARELGLDAAPAEPDAVADCDLICTCTTSPEPLFDGAALAPGAHVNAIGSYKKESREIDSATVARAALVVVEELEVAEESGDLAVPIDEGILARSAPVPLAAVLDRPTPGAAEITVFKSVGRAFEDLAVAELVAAALD